MADIQISSDSIAEVISCALFTSQATEISVRYTYGSTNGVNHKETRRSVETNIALACVITYLYQPNTSGLWSRAEMESMFRVLISNEQRMCNAPWHKLCICIKRLLRFCGSTQGDHFVVVHIDVHGKDVAR